MQKIISFIATFLCFSILPIYISNSYAQGSGTTGGEVLKLAVGERAVAMGGAFSSIADNVTAIYWNPAGLSQLGKKEISVMKLNYLLDIESEYYSYAHPLGKFGIIGVELSVLHSLDIRRDEYATAGTVYSNQEKVLALSYSRWITSKISLGGNLKTVYTNLDNDETSGIGIDIGTLFKTPVENLNIGIVLQNIDTGLKYTSEKETIPFNFKIGTSYRLLDNNLIFSIDADNFTGNASIFSLGSEYRFIPISKLNIQLPIRIGYKAPSTNNAMSGISSGFGFKFRDYSIDYAYVPYGQLGDTKRISLTLKF